MSLPDFLGRVYDAAGPILGGMTESELGRSLESTSVVFEIDAEAAAHKANRAAYLLAGNIGARLYPRLGFDAPSELADTAVSIARQINPQSTIGPPRSSDRPLILSWRGGEASADRVTVAANGWNVSVDGGEPTAAAELPAAMAAAALGVGELFRTLFAPSLDHGRDEPAPFELNLLTLGGPIDSPPIPGRVEIGEVHLAGCGAVGQAAAATLRELPVHGTLYAVDFDPLDKGNLQRYVLSYAAAVGTAKPTLIERAFEDHPLQVRPIPTVWGADERTAPGRRTILSALDSLQGRIELQAGLPCEIFNAWTQPRDVGVSRHQDFGNAPCLACLGWPQRPRSSETALIAAALREHELRVIHYLRIGTPVGNALPPQAIEPAARLALPDNAARWGERSLLDDVVERFSLAPDAMQEFRALTVGQLYRDGVCAGALLRRQDDQVNQPELSVPLAHQSALAGILLATWLLVDRVPELRTERPKQTVARYNVLRGGSQRWPRPRGPDELCICQDPDFQAVNAERWNVDP